MPRTLGEIESESKEDRTPIIAVISALALIIGVGVSLASSSNTIPRETFFLLAAGLLLLAIVLFVTLFYKPLRNQYGVWQKNRIARRNYPQLVRFCERFHGFTEYNMTNNPQYVIGNIRSNPGFESVFLVPPHYANFFSYELQNGVKTLKPSLNTFVWVADLLTTTIRFYSEVFVAGPILQIRAIADSGAGKIVSNYRADYNVARERFVGFVGEYEEFVSKTNKELGQVKRKVGDSWRSEEFLRSYYIERPKEL